jgi:hypothetical protein
MTQNDALEIEIKPAMNFPVFSNERQIMKYPFVLFVACLCLSINKGMAASPAVSLVPSTQSIAKGGTADVDVMISGLGNHEHPALGAWYITLTYDPVIANATSVLFGNFLAPSFQDYVLTTPGQVDLLEVSFALPEALIAQQPDSFLLATVGFTGLEQGLLNVNLSYADLSDENGQTIPEAGSTFHLLALISAGLLGLKQLRPAIFKKR